MNGLKPTTFLSPEPHGFFTAHVISEIVTQTNVNYETSTDPCFFWFWGHRRLWPQNQKKHTHPPKHGTDCLHGQKCEVRTPFLTSLYPIFLPCKQPLNMKLKKISTKTTSLKRNGCSLQYNYLCPSCFSAFLF